jgi:hypothetical protein
MEIKYNSYEGECFIVDCAISSFKCYLFVSSFSLVTNHQLFKSLMESNCLRGKLTIWAFIL